MVSDTELIDRLREFLQSSDLNTTTTAIVRRKLEQDFGIDLSDKKAFIREQVDLFLQAQVEEQEKEEEEDEEEKSKVKSETSNASHSEEASGGEDEEEEDEEEDTSNAKTRKKRVSYKKNKDVKKRGGGFTKLCSLSPELQKLVGVPKLARTEVVKQLWAYIREKNLQDPKDRRNIICDKALHAIFRVDTVNMFKMNKALSKHIWPLDTGDEPEGGEPEQDDAEDEKPKVKSEASNASNSEADDNEEEEEEEKSNGKGRKKVVSNKMNTDVKKKVGGFNKLCSLSPDLQKIVGVSELARTEVVKQLWVYIRENNLQDPNNKREIICDKAFRDLFQVDSINMFQMNKALSKHIWPLDAGDALVKSAQKEKQRKHEKPEESDEEEPKEKRQKGGSSGFLAPLPLSDALVNFLGTNESSLSRSDVVKRIWEYIKQNNLQDPADKRSVICDEKLKQLFDVESFNGFTVSKLLSAHFIKSQQ